MTLPIGSEAGEHHEVCEKQTGMPILLPIYMIYLVTLSVSQATYSINWPNATNLQI